MRKLLLLQFNLQTSLVLAQFQLIAPVFILSQLQRHRSFSFQLRYVILVLVQQMLYFLLVDLRAKISKIHTMLKLYVCTNFCL